MSLDYKNTNSFSLSMLQQVIDYIEIYLLEGLTPTTIANHFYISVSTLSSLFKITCQITLMEYVRNRKLTLATEELISSDIPIIELAYKYGYETPEAFTKAFSRFHGFPPSFVRRGFPITRSFLPLQISVTIQGGWDYSKLTKSNCFGQDSSLPLRYNTSIGINTGKQGQYPNPQFYIDTSVMQYRKEWTILCSLTKRLLLYHIPFKIDGKTMIFAHGLEFPIEKICLTFKWKDEAWIKDFFFHDMETHHPEPGFKYFDVMYQNMKIRCMFYGNCPSDDTDAFLYQNTDWVQVDHLVLPVQSLQFYYENAEKTSIHYQKVKEWLAKNERVQCTE